MKPQNKNKKKSKPRSQNSKYSKKFSLKSPVHHKFTFLQKPRNQLVKGKIVQLQHDCKTQQEVLLSWISYTIYSKIKREKEPYLSKETNFFSHYYRLNYKSKDSFHRILKYTETPSLEALFE